MLYTCVVLAVVPFMLVTCVCACWVLHSESNTMLQRCLLGFALREMRMFVWFVMF